MKSRSRRERKLSDPERVKIARMVTMRLGIHGACSAPCAQALASSRDACRRIASSLRWIA